MKQPLETTLLRIGLTATGVICWQGATHIWETGAPISYPSSIALMFAGYLVGFFLFIFAALRAPPHWSVWAILAALSLPILCHAEGHRIAILQNGTLTTDLQIYMDYGARLLRNGENPYAHNLLEAYRIHRAPFNFSTFLADGDLTGRMAYPALSVLIFVPFQWLGIPTHWIYLVFLIAAFVLLFLWAPPTIRPLVLIPFFLDKRYMLYTIGGVSDVVWALLLVLVVRTWRDHRWRAIWYGLACAFKHQPWLLAPFLLIRIWRESSAPAPDRLREMGRFAGLSLATFLVVNLPFVVWDPAAWLRGVFEPVLAPMITFGQGLSLLTMLGIAVIPKWAFSLMLGAVMGLGLLAYYRHFSRLRSLIWLLPGLVLWFSNRSLTSYWYFFLFPFILDLLSTEVDDEAAEPASPAWKPLLLGVTALVAVIIGVTITFTNRSTGVDAAVVPPMYSTGNHIDRMQVQVTNSSERPIKPLFALQWGVLQPFFWTIEKGPLVLRPQERARYTISTDVPFARFDIRQGVRLTVSHSGSYQVRHTIRIDPDPSYVYPDVIPNGRFLYWERSGNQPTFWGVVTHPAGSGQISLIRPRGPGAPETGLRFQIDRPSGEGRSFVLLDTYVTLPHRPIDIWVKVPEAANRLPDLDLVYGLNLTVEESFIWILFGDEKAKGQVSANTYYWMMPAPRGVWSRRIVDLRRVLADLGRTPAPVRKRMPRFHHLDFPFIPTNFQLLLSAREPSVPVVAEFGPVLNQAIQPDPAVLFRYARQTPEALPLWLGEFSFSMRNYPSARKHFAAATRLAPRSGLAFLRLGEAEFWSGNRKAAISAFLKATTLDPQDPLPYKGLGWCYINQRRFEKAIRVLAYAAKLFERRSKAEERIHFADVHKGLGIALLHQKACEEAEVHLQKMVALDPSLVFSQAALSRCKREQNDGSELMNQRRIEDRAAPGGEDDPRRRLP